MNLSGAVKINKCGVLILSVCVVIVFYYLLFNNSMGSHRFRSHGFLIRNPNEVDLRKLLIGSIQAAQYGGLEVLSVADADNIHAKTKGRTKEGANDPLTNADLKSHCVMEQGLKRLFSTVTIISEEDVHADCSETSHFELDPTVIDEDIHLQDDFLVNADDVTIWIDPLDATQEYTENLFQYVTTMVCVAIRGEPVIGVIHNPFSQKTFWAWKDVAVSASLRKVKDEPVNKMAAVKNPKIIASRSHSGDVEHLIKMSFGENTPIELAGGAGYKVLQVVFGNATNYVHLTEIKKWDLCAGNAILSALNGQMTSLKNQPILYERDPQTFVNKDGVIASLRNHPYYAGKVYDYLQHSQMIKSTNSK
ncbi:putative inositol monophosphatase 3 [Contarinia nasturtii]|uniref:putative inositol monophosphatase 3 n=1 Tax=Contarinia nasturtii TaxID=265458 RepID=UPI0012D420AA|nr:putative inositol monophosphatase 3 [Contarinia nasturtii]